MPIEQPIDGGTPSGAPTDPAASPQDARGNSGGGDANDRGGQPGAGSGRIDSDPDLEEVFPSPKALDDDDTDDGGDDGDDDRDDRDGD